MQRRLRLRRSEDFQRLRHEGGAKKHPYGILSYAPNDLTHNRYGFITSKRLGNAVTRNRVRRVVREAVRLLHPRLRQGYDVVFIVRPAAVAQPFAEVQRIVIDLFTRAGLLAEETSDDV